MLTSLLIILPVLLAGLTFILILKFFPNFLNFPLDFSRTYNGKRIFGQNKTIKGPLIMTLFTGLFGISFYNYLNFPTTFSIFLSYALIGLLYSLGELPNSFFKRQLNISPGSKAIAQPWKTIFNFLDIYDSLFFCYLGYVFIFNFDSYITFVTILFSGVLHLLTDVLMKKLKLKQYN
jgi:hypothetical protein